MDFRGAFSAITKPFSKPAGYTGALEEAKAAAPAPAPVAAPAPQIGGMNMTATQRREKAAGLANGGSVGRYGARRPGASIVQGPGTGTSDSVPAKVPPETFILPADTTEKVNLSKGELKVMPEVVMAAGAAALQAVLDATHTPVKPKPAGMNNGGKVCRAGARRKDYANGGWVSEEDEYAKAASMIANPSVAVAAPAAAPARRPSAAGAVVRGAFDDARAAVGQGRYGAAAGDVLRGAAALPVAVAADTVAPLAAPASAALEGAKDFAGSLAAGSTQAGAPQLGARPPASAAATVPQPARPATAVAGAGAAPVQAPSQAVAAPVAAADPTQPAAPAQTSQDRIGIYNRAGQTYREIAAMQLAGNQTPAGMGMTVGPDRQAERNLQFDAQTLRDQAIKRGGRGAGVMMVGAERLDERASRAATPDNVRAIQANQAVAAATAQKSAADLQREEAREAGADRRAAPAAAESVQRIGVSRDQQDQTRAVARLQAKFATTTDPAERTRLREQIMLAQGKEPAANRYTVVPGGQTVDPTTGQVVREPAQVLDNQTGQMVSNAAQAAPKTAPPPAAVQMLKSKPELAAQFDAKYGPGAAARAMGRG